MDSKEQKKELSCIFMQSDGVCMCDYSDIKFDFPSEHYCLETCTHRISDKEKENGK